jgi:hypothetical protein
MMREEKEGEQRPAFEALDSGLDELFQSGGNHLPQKVLRFDWQLVLGL